MLVNKVWAFCIIVLFLAGVPLYGEDNLLTNPGFETGTTTGWYSFGSTIAASANPHTGAYSALVSDRTAGWSGIAQTLLGKLTDGQTCLVSGCVKLQNASSANVTITIKQTDDNGDHYYPVVYAMPCTNSGWTNLSNIFTLNATGTLTQLFMYFEGPDAGVNFYVDDVSVVVTDSGDWEAEANQRIEQMRKGDFCIIAAGPNDPDQTVPNVSIQVNQIRHHFAFGSAINTNISNPDYAEFFRNHLEWAVMENESKWYQNEYFEDQVTYENADAIYDFCSSHDITMRGHCIFWAAEGVIQDWLKALSYAPLPATSDLRTAVEDRLDSAVNHFKGKFRHWDVNNEMCNNSFFADRLGYDIRPWMFQAAHAIDPNCMLFLNDYNVINGGYNLSAYKQMAYDLAAQGAPIHGLGVQCHMSTGFSPATVKARFDSIAEAALPIWVTEFDISNPDENIRADELEDFYRVAFSHPAVEGILMWGFWENSHWREDAHLVNADWTLNAAGVRYESLMNEWTTHDSDVTNENGSAAFRGFYGTYTVTLTPAGAEDPTLATIEVTPGGTNEFTIALTDMTVPTTCQEVQDFGYRMPADLDGNCQTDLSDFVILADQWISDTPAAFEPNHSPDMLRDDHIDLDDFEILAGQWMVCNDPQESTCIQTW